MDHSASQYRGRTPCRCDRCTADHRRRYNAERAARRSQCIVVDGRRYAPHPTVPHGTTTGYGFWGCQCTACTRANTNASNAYRHRKGSRS